MKDKNVVEEKVFFGRVKSNLKMGIVGLPNVGKSTFFNVLTKSNVKAENFPFCTIEPEESRVQVTDERFDWLCDLYKPVSKVPAYLSVVDIAGLVRGASTGSGLGNDFLSHIRSVDGIFHLVRAFKDESVVHVEGDVDPIRDIEIINEELRFKDESVMLKTIGGLKRQLSINEKDKEKRFEFDTLEKALCCVSEKKKDLRQESFTFKEIEFLNTFQFLTAKEVVFLVNVSERDYERKKNKWLPIIKKYLDSKYENVKMIVFSADYEKKNLEKTSPKIIDIVDSGYKILNLYHFFTAGPDEVRCWTIRSGTKAPQAAGVIHTDFERGFIKAEVMKYEDLKKEGNETSVKAIGKFFQKGKMYVVEDGDIINFKFNVSSSKKKK